MGFVDDQDVKFSLYWAFVNTWDQLIESAHMYWSLDEIHRSDQAREMAPRIDFDSSTSPEFLHRGGIDYPKIEAELLQHLGFPVGLNWRWTNDQHGSCPMADDELLNDQPSFDGLSQSYVIRNKKVGARHFDRSD